jgi:hypothetical protein
MSLVISYGNWLLGKRYLRTSVETRASTNAQDSLPISLGRVLRRGEFEQNSDSERRTIAEQIHREGRQSAAAPNRGQIRVLLALKSVP